MVVVNEIEPPLINRPGTLHDILHCPAGIVEYFLLVVLVEEVDTLCFQDLTPDGLLQPLSQHRNHMLDFCLRRQHQFLIMDLGKLAVLISC